jgi:hypothetical protein
LYAEDLSRRDSVKVAQYEVLGNDAKRYVRPGRDDRKRSAFGLARRSAIASIGRSSRPGRIPLLRTLTQHFVLGYFREVPAGLIFSNHQPRSRSRPLKLMPMGSSGPTAHFERNDVTIICEKVHFDAYGRLPGDLLIICETVHWCTFRSAEPRTLGRKEDNPFE